MEGSQEAKWDLCFAPMVERAWDVLLPAYLSAAEVVVVALTGGGGEPFSHWGPNLLSAAPRAASNGSEYRG